MKRFFHSIVQWVRELLLDKSAGVMNWVSEQLTIAYDNWYKEDSLRVRALRWIDARATDVHSFAYPGSDTEEQLALEACIPAKHMSDRQRAIALAAFENPVATCNRCQWLGFIHQAEDFSCPSCGSDSIRWDERMHAWVPYRDERALAVRPTCSVIQCEGASATISDGLQRSLAQLTGGVS